MKGHVKEGEYYYIKIAHGAELSLNASLNVIAGVNLTAALFELEVTFGLSLAVAAGAKFTMVGHESEFTGFKARAEAKNLKSVLSEIKTIVNEVEALAKRNRAALTALIMDASNVDIAMEEARAALSESRAGLNSMAALGLGRSAALNEGEVVGSESGAVGVNGSINASQVEGSGSKQNLSGSSTNLRGASLNASGASTGVGGLDGNNGALVLV